MSGFTTLNCVFNKSLNLLKPVRVSILEFSPQTGRIDDTNHLCVWVRSPITLRYLTIEETARVYGKNTKN